jgi:hypothetical protein
MSSTFENTLMNATTTTTATPSQFLNIESHQRNNPSPFFQPQGGNDPVLTQLILQNNNSNFHNNNSNNSNFYQNHHHNHQQQQQQQQQSSSQYVPITSSNRQNFFTSNIQQQQQYQDSNQYILLNQPQQHQQQQQMNFNHQMFSMSLPANYTGSGNANGGFLSMNFLNAQQKQAAAATTTTTTAAGVNNSNCSSNSSSLSHIIKQEYSFDSSLQQPMILSASDSRLKNIAEDNDEKFSRLKLSSPLSALYQHQQQQQQLSPSLDAIHSSIFDVDTIVNGGDEEADIDVIAALAPNSLIDSSQLQQHQNQQQNGLNMNMNDLFFSEKSAHLSLSSLVHHNQKSQFGSGGGGGGGGDSSTLMDNEEEEEVDAKVDVNIIANELRIAAINSRSGNGCGNTASSINKNDQTRYINKKIPFFCLVTFCRVFFFFFFIIKNELLTP